MKNKAMNPAILNPRALICMAAGLCLVAAEADSLMVFAATKLAGLACLWQWHGTLK